MWIRLQAMVGVIALVIALVVGAVGEVAAQDKGARPTVAVIQFNNSSLVNAAEYAPMSKGMADLIGSTLAGNPAIRVVERDALQEVLREQDLATSGRIDDATAAKVGQLLGAQFLIKGTFFIEPKGRMRIAAQAVNSTTGEIAYSETANGTKDNLLEVIDALAVKLTAGLKLGTLTPPDRGREASGSTRWAALMQYSRALEADDGGNTRSALALYNEFLKSTQSTVYASDQRRHAEERVRMLAGGA